MDEPVAIIQTPIRLEYNYTPGVARSRFLNGLKERRILGERCDRCGKVYVGGGSGACARDGVPMTDVVELPHRGTVTTFCVVNVPFAGATVQIPYTTAAILVDGADIPLNGLIQEIDANDVRMGLRVEAVWSAEEGTALGDMIKYWKPTGEPDAAIDDVFKRMRADA